MSDKGKRLQETGGSGLTERPDVPIDIPIRHELHLAGGHTGAITSLAVTPDGKRLVTGSDDGTARLWDLKTGQCLRVFERHKGPVKAVAVTPDGKRLITGSEDRTARLWDLETGKHIRVFDGHKGTVWAAAVTPDGRWLATGAGEQTVQLWNLATGECRKFTGQPGWWFCAMAVTPDGQRLVAGGGRRGGGIVRLWDLKNGCPICTYRLPEREVYTVAVSPDGRWLATAGSYDGTVKLWDLALHEPLYKPVRVFKGHKGKVNAVAVTPDGKRLITGSEDGTARLWELQTGKLVREFPGDRKVSAVAVTPDGRRLVTGSGSLGGIEGTARLWDIESGECLQVFTGQTLHITAAAMIPDGKWLAIGSWDGTVRLWDLKTGHLLQVIEGQMGWVKAVALTLDGSHLVAVSDWLLGDGKTRVWDLESGVCNQQLNPESRVEAVAVTPDGKQLVTGGKRVQVWELKTGAHVRTFKEHMYLILAVAVTSDGRRLVTGSTDGIARLWDLETGKLVMEFPGDKWGISAVTVTPDGRQLITESWDGTVRLWDLKSGECRRGFEGHKGWGTAFAITPDGSKLITVGRDHTVRFWDLNTGELLVTMYNLKEGFLWTTSPTPSAPSGWLWTDRFDLISVVECDKEDCSNPVPLPLDDPRREAHLKSVNSRKMVMSRLWLSREEIQALEEESAEHLKRSNGKGDFIEKLPGGRKGGEK